MPLYQTSVLKKHIKLQDSEVIQKAYKKYVKYFHNTTIQENINNSKEEEYQGIFLTELFVNILGYTLSPKPDFNLVAEYKNLNNARKADGAILKDNNAIGVIELKGTKTKDLESIRQQAFDYKANQKDCTYIITSNFEKLRFYINDATEFEEFNLFQLTETRFSLLYLCLSKESIYKNLPLKIKDASLIEEELIAKGFYKDYSLFKRELYRDLVKLNAKNLKKARQSELYTIAIDSAAESELLKLEKNVKLTLFKKSQKLIDRFLFVFFAEDRGLLPPNSTIRILKDWDKLQDLDAVIPLYDRFRLYFRYLDTGRKGTDKKAEIFAYNGGLFKPDNLLDTIEISDDLLYKHTKKLANYDFESQVDVNILGHIFENSLNEIESVNAEIEGGEFDKQKSKRKKDGVFYTPKYITKYIVENTVGKLCEEKKQELGFKEEEYYKGRKNRNKTTIARLVVILDDYREWLLQLTICDPACGSGAFLNQALDFLIKEHDYIDELKTKILGGGFQFSDIEITILENNIFGVDLNEESVEIAKLSLWLRTAQPRRKLNDLSSNIKCGNSLIDSKTVGGDKAFNWQEQFFKVFDKGGFDVIIGNPPYVVLSSFENKEFEYLQNTYKTAFGRLNLFSLFVEKCSDLINKAGLVGLIIPDSLCLIDYYTDLRKLLISNFNINQLIEIGDGVFDDATVPALVIIFEGGYNPKNTIETGFGKDVVLDFKEPKIIKQNIYFDTPKFSFNLHIDDVFIKVHNLIKLKKAFALKDVLQIKIGVCTGSNKKHLNSLPIFSNSKKVLQGRDINRYSLKWNSNYINYSKEELLRSRDEQIFLKPEKLLMRQTSDKLILTYDNSQYYTIDSLFVIYLKNEELELKYALAILNSKLLNRQYQKLNPETGRVFAQVKIDYVNEIPIIIPSIEKQLLFISKVDYLIVNSKKVTDLIQKMTHYLKTKFHLNKLSRKLENWQKLEYGNFTKELNKAIKLENKDRLKEGKHEIHLLTKKDEFEWLDLFEENKKKAQDLKIQINKTDKEIDAMVYELYGLTNEEIEIVENS
jgi:type I restriction-modification system DNA methylase subunit